MSKLIATYNHSLRSMIKNYFVKNHIGLEEDCPSSDFVKWRYRITNKGLYQITDATSLIDFQQQQQLKWIADVSRRGKISHN